MRLLFVTGMILAVAVLGLGTAFASYPDYVDIGDPTSETGHNLQGWGLIEPAASGGNYGGIDHCRVIYCPGEVEGQNWACVDMDFGPAVFAGKCLMVRHLDGQSGTDYWYVTVNGVYVGAHDDSPGGDEHWVISEFSVSDCSGICTVMFWSTEPCWSGFDLYGQVAIDEITVGYCGSVAVGETTWGNVKALYR
ncbi:hypothetical protein ACFL2Z_03470 [Candidatus Eisenbacteria bacterium]|uniref:Uncharacterized protein n=1 Tax=Eiseniibacteriota bacterium TaxID=2212470 RepID=A0ABV6YPG3_UNCEI